MLENRSHWILILALCALAAFTLVIGNGGISLTHPDEVFYVQTAKEMMTHKTWLVPYLFDQPQFEKPIFTYWCLILSMKALGVNAFAARFVPAAFGFLGVLLVYWMAFFIFRRKTIAVLSAFILATSFIWVALSRSVLTDMVFSFWVVLAIACFYYGYLYQKRKTLGLLLCGVFCGVAVLAKGALGIIFPLGIIFLFLVYRRDLKFLKCWASLWSVLILIAIALPWHVYIYNQFGKSFIDEYWVNDHVRRIFEAEHQKSNTWYFYPMTIVAGVFPWSFFLIPAGVFLYGVFRRQKELQPHFVFLLLWMAWVLGVMQVAQSKLASYIFPLFPGVAILLGFYFNKIFSKDAGDSREDVQIARLHYVFSITMAILMLLGCLAGVYFIKKYAVEYNAVIPGYVCMALSFLWATSFFVFTLRKDFKKSFWLSGSLIAILLVSLSFSYKAAEPWVSCKQICDVFKRLDNSKDVILTSKFYARGIHFYTDRPVAIIDINGSGFFSPHPVPFLAKDEDVVQFLSERPITYAIVKKHQWEDLERIVQGKFKMTFYEEIGGKYILKIERLGKAA